MIWHLGHKLELKYTPNIFLKNHYKCTECLATIYFSLNGWVLLSDSDNYLGPLDLNCDEYKIKKLLE